VGRIVTGIKRKGGQQEKEGTREGYGTIKRKDDFRSKGRGVKGKAKFHNRGQNDHM